MKIVLETTEVCTAGLFTEVDFESGMTCINESPYPEAHHKGCLDFPAGTIGVEFESTSIDLVFENTSISLSLDGSVNVCRKDKEEDEFDRLVKIKTISDDHSQGVHFQMECAPSFQIHRVKDGDIFQITLIW